MSGSRFVSPYFWWPYPSGEPIPDALLNFYVYPGSTPATTYSDTNLVTANTNPVVADGNGVFPSIWLDPTVTYRVVLSYPSDGINPPVQIWSAGPVYGAAAVPSSGVVWVDDYGAEPGNLSFDSYAAIAAALASGAGVVMLSNGGYRSSAGITVPDGVTLQGVNFQPGNPPTGSVIVFDLGVGTCVTDSNGDGKPAAIRNFSVSRAAGSIPANSVGVLFNSGYNLRAENIMAHRQYNGFRWLTVGPNGLGSMCRGLYTGVISGYHTLFDTWPEARLQQCRFGMNGTGDVAANAYVGITGGGTGGQGPNSLVFENCQFNCGAAPGPLYGIQFFNNANTGSNCLEFNFTDCHWETYSSAWIKSDATTIAINRLGVTGCTVNGPSVPAFALDAATAFSETSFVGNRIFTSTFNLGPQQFVGFSMTGVYCSGSASFNASAGSTIALANNSWANGLTIAGAGLFSIMGDRLVSGSFTNNATGIVLVQSVDFNGARNFTPTLTIGGGSTGITYAAQSGTYEYLTSTQVKINIVCTLANKGALTGNVALASLPVTANATYGGADAGLVANFTLSGITGPIYAQAVAGGTTLNLVQGTSSGTATVTNTNLTNSSGIQTSITVKV